MRVCHTRVCAEQQPDENETQKMGIVCGFLVWYGAQREGYGLSFEMPYAKISPIDGFT